MERRVFHTVLSVCIERGYPADPLSVARETVAFSTHADREEATGSYLAALDADMLPDALLALRRSFLVQVEIPEAAMACGCPRRWMSDRPGLLIRLAGRQPGIWSRAVQAAAEGPLLAADLCGAADRLAASLAQGTDAPGGLAAAAMILAGAAARATWHGVLAAELSRKLAGVARAIGSAAWEGADALHLQPSLDALLPDLPRPAAEEHEEVPQVGWMPRMPCYGDFAAAVMATMEGDGTEA